MDHRVGAMNESRSTRTLQATRRETLGHLGGAAVLAAVAAIVPGERLLAHEATLIAGEVSGDRYTVIRIRKVRADRSGEELTALVEAGFIPQLRELPGFVSYVVLWNAETRNWITIGTFTDKEAGDESSSIAAAFGESSGTRGFVEGDPIVIDGSVLLAAEGGK